MKLFDLIFGKKSKNDEISNRELENYISNLEIESDFVRLDGPFLCANYALKYIDLYKPLLKKTYYAINICVNRSLAVISYDSSFETRDNSRIELGISPYNHRFEIHIEGNDFSVVGVDGNILLNLDDSKRIKSVMKKFPLTSSELRLASRNNY